MTQKKKQHILCDDRVMYTTTMLSPWRLSIHPRYAAYGPTHSLVRSWQKTTVLCRLLSPNIVLNLTVSYSLIFPLSPNWTNRRSVELYSARVWQSENRLAASLTTANCFLCNSPWKNLTPNDSNVIGSTKVRTILQTTRMPLKRTLKKK